MPRLPCRTHTALLFPRGETWGPSCLISTGAIEMVSVASIKQKRREESAPLCWLTLGADDTRHAVRSNRGPICAR